MIRAFGHFILSLFRRDGLAAVGKVFRHAFSPKAWRRLFSGIRDKRTLKASGLVDEDWYRREYPDVAERGIDPVQDFLTPPHPRTRLPNPDFVPGEYAAVNLDVKAGGMDAALHYAKYGIRERRAVSTLEKVERPFPGDAVELRREFPSAPVSNRRTAVFASFSGDGRIKEPVLYYLRGLREVADNIVFVSNNPTFPDEVAKLDGLVRLAVFRHHGGYDFGSYKIGWNEAKALGLLEPDVCDELVVCNDSCIGPVFPFPELFGEMAARGRKAGRPADFWGMSVVRQYGRRMIPSYFYVFGPAVLEGAALGRWFEGMEPCRNRGQVILRCESVLTQYLEDRGFVCDGLVPESFQAKHGAPPIKYPLMTLRDYRDPLVKTKALRGDTFEDLDEVRSFLREANPELSAIIPRFDQEGGKPFGIDIARAARRNHEASLRETEDALRRRMESGAAVPVVFFSLSGNEAWLRPPSAWIPSPPRFAPAAAAIPDLRLESEAGRLAQRRAAQENLAASFPEWRIVDVQTDSDGEWTDALPDPGIVFYPAASDWSDFRYNPHFAVGRSVLPVLVFDRGFAAYPLEKEFARQNYAYFWKIFFTDRESFDLYRAHSIRKGANAVLSEDGNAAAALLRTLQCPLSPL